MCRGRLMLCQTQSCFEYSLSKDWDLFLSTKNTILKKYDGMFMVRPARQLAALSVCALPVDPDPSCQADKSAVATVSETKEPKRH